MCNSRYLADADHHVNHRHVLGNGSTLGMPSAHAYIGESKQFFDGQSLPVEDRQVSTSSHNFVHWNVCPRLLLTNGNVTAISENFSDDLSHLPRLLPSLKAWMPGWWLKAHCIYQPDRVPDHIRLMRAIDPDGIPEIGLVLPENMPDETLAEVKKALES